MSNAAQRLTMPDLLPINVVIGDRTYRLKIQPADEEMVRGTVKLINDKILEFRTRFAGKDMQDYIAMVLLWYATEMKQGGAGPDENLLAGRLAELAALVDKTLEK